MRRAAWIAFLVLAASCSLEPDRHVEQERRIHDQLGLDPPFRVQGAYFLDDCGTGCTRVFASGDTIDLYADNRCVPIPNAWSTLPPESTSARLDRVEHHLWLHDYPDSPSARELAFNSPAESAAIDLVRLAISTSFHADEESMLVRGERLARRQPHPDYEWSVWDSKLTERQRGLRGLRQFVERVEFRRQKAAGSAP